MRSKNVLLGSITTAILSIVTMISGFIIPRLVIMEYGSDINGLSNSVAQFISYFTLLESGLAGAAIFALYKPIAESDYDGINKIVSASKNYYNRIGMWYILLAVVFSAIYGFLFDSAMSSIDTMLLVLAISVGGALEFITMSKYRVLLTAMQKTYVVSIASIFSAILKIVVMYVLIKLHCNIILVKFAGSASILVRSLIFSIYVKKKYKFVDYSVSAKGVKLEQRGDVLLMQVLGSAQHAFPTIAMTICHFPFYEISVYSVYAMVTSGMVSLLQVVLNGSIYSTFGNVISKNEYTLLKKVFGEFEVGCYALISVLFGAAAILYMPFISIYTNGMTDANYIQPTIAVLLLISTLFAVIKNPLSAMIQAAGHYKKTRWRTIVQTAIAVIGPLALAKPLGIAGIIIGTMCSHIYRTIDILIYVPNKITRTSTFTSLKRMLVCVASALLAYFGFGFIAKVAATTYTQWIVYGVIVSVWVCAITFVINIIFNRREMMDLFSRVKMLLKKRRA